MQSIIIAKEFSDSVGGRYREEGDYSGQEFRENLLEPRLKETIEKNDTLLVDFDGGYGYPTSFLEEAFGGLVRNGFKKHLILKVLKFKSDDNQRIINRVTTYIMEAEENEK